MRHVEFDPRRTGSPGHASAWPAVLAAVVALAALFAPSLQAQAQQTGRIVGRVTDSQSGAPISEAQVFIPGTGLGGLTRTNGAFVILEVPAGPKELRAERIGLAPVSQQITVVAGQALEVNIQMTTQALGLDEIVVTGTAGAARRREVGNTISQINVAQNANKPSASVELLQAAAPGISVTRTDGNLGGGYNIRLRGNKSVSMTNSPIIYIDGVRMQSKPFPVGNSSVARQANGGSANIEANPLNNINPADIERIEVIKGSAATTLYGTEASAGVIQVFTKKGASGKPVWNVEIAQSLNKSIKYGPNWAGITGGDGPDGYEYLRMDPYLRTGRVGDYSASVRGGGQALQYFMSAATEEGFGVLPNDSISKITGRGNYTFSPSSVVQIQWNNAYALQKQRNSPVGGNVYGVQLNVYRGYVNYFNSDKPDTVNLLFTQDLRNQIERFTTGSTVTYSPLSNLTNRLTLGYDFSNQETRNILPFGFIFFPQGQVWNDTWQNRILTLDYVGTYSFDITSAIKSSFSWGGQTLGEETRRLTGYGENFPGAADPTVNSSATRIAEEERSKIWNAGFFVQDLFSIKDRYFITLGMRVDGNSAFGSGFGLQMYPKASLSWVASDEGFWGDGWGALKVRAAYGQSGRAPGAFDAVRTWESQGWGTAPALLPRNLGNADIGPEVTAETEVGFDAEWFDGRLSSALTYYRQITSDALFNVSAIPTNGFSQAQRMNVGKLENNGLEVAINTAPIRGASFGWDLGVNVSTNHSKVLDMGGIAPFSTGGAWVEEGYAVGALRSDYMRNGEAVAKTATGAIATTIPACESAAWKALPDFANQPCTEAFHIYGPTQPTLTVSPTTTLRLPAGVSLSATGEYRGGHYMSDGVTSGGVTRSAWMPTCWPYYVKPYEGKSNDFKGFINGESLALKDDTPARWRGACTPALSKGGYTAALADYFVLRSVSALVPLDFVTPDRISSAMLTLSMNNAWRWLNDEWIVMDPDMATADGLVNGTNTRTAPVWNVNASLRLQF
jgi:outer membrane receptor protein involved in Fe transport